RCAHTGNRHQVVAKPARTRERRWRADRRDVEGRPRPLRRARERSDMLILVVPAVRTDVLAFEERADLLDAFLEARDALIHRNAEVAELVWQESARKADVETFTAYRIEHGELAGELQGMIKRRQHGTGDQPRAFRALRGRGEKEDGIGAVAAPRMEIVFDDAHVCVAIHVTPVDEA